MVDSDIMLKVCAIRKYLRIENGIRSFELQCTQFVHEYGYSVRLGGGLYKDNALQNTRKFDSCAYKRI